MILVMGATGNVGGEVVKALLAAGERVRAMTRRPAEATLPQGVEVVAGDLADAGSISRALEGIERAFVFPPLRGAAAFLEGARSSGLKRLVLLSSSSAQEGAPGRDNVLAQSHVRVEDAIQASAWGWTFLRPSGFATNALAWAASIRAEGVVRGPYPEATVAPIDARDIAAVAAKALLEEGHVGKKYVLTGGESLTQNQQLEAIAKALGRELRFETIPVEAARTQMSQQMPPPYVNALLELQANSVGVPARLSPVVRELTGRTPRPFAEWAREHVAAFQ